MRRLRMLVAVFAMLALLGACARTTVVRTPPRGKPSVSRPTSPPKPGSSALVRKGDTLFAIAKRYGVTVENLRSWNGLRGSALSIGDRLQIHGGRAANDQ